MLRRIFSSAKRVGFKRSLITNNGQFTRITAQACSSVRCVSLGGESFKKVSESGEKMVPIASYEELKAAGADENIYIIDVREPSELEETGKIPGSINIPLKTVEDTLKNTSADDFKSKFGREKPTLDAPIIFSCRSGRRSLAALKIAESLGFTNLKNFDGGWLLWDERSKH